MTDISFLKAVVKWKNIRTGTPISNKLQANKNCTVEKKILLAVFMWSDKASYQSQGVCDLLCQFNWGGQDECLLQARGVDRVESDRRSVTRRVGPVLRPVGCRRPSATPAGSGHWSSLGAYRGRIVTKAGMHGTMDHSLADVLKQLGVSAFNRRGRLPLYGPQSIVCFPPRTEKVVFCEGARPTIMWWLSPLSQQSPSAEWTLWLTWSICLCVGAGGKLQKKKATLWVT